MVLGVSGYTYKVIISKEKMSCACIDFKTKKRTCKHLYFIVCRIADNLELLKKMNDNPKLTKKFYINLDNLKI